MMANFHKNTIMICSIVIFQEKNFLSHFAEDVEKQSDFGVVGTQDLDIVGFEEKPVYVSYINTGIYMLNPSIFKYLN